MARILLVEDEAIVSIMAEMMLFDLGHTVIGPAATIQSALELVRTEAIDIALLDVNIAGDRVYPVADALLEKNIPFAFATGYGVAGLAERYRCIRVIDKPYGELEIAEAISALS